MTIAINITRHLIYNYAGAGSIVSAGYKIANDKFDNDNFTYQRGGVYDSLSPDGVTFFSNESDALSYLLSDAWTTILGNLNSNTFDPNAGNYVQGSLVEYEDTVQDDFDSKVDKITGKGLSANDYTNTEKTKLSGIFAGATLNSSDATLLDRANHTGTQSIATISGLNTALAGKTSPSDVSTAVSSAITALVNGAPGAFDTLKELADQLALDETGATALAVTVGNKVDKVSGKGLSSNDYTTTDKNKVAALPAHPLVSGITAKDGAFAHTDAVAISGGAGQAIFQLTVDGLSTGSALFPNGVDATSFNFYVNDSSTIYTYSHVLSNGNKTLTVTAKTLNLLALGLSNAANAKVVNLLCFGN